MDIVVFDLETTGLSARTHEIIEIGAVVWRDGELLDTFHSLVRPEMIIPDEVYQLTGLTPDAFHDAPPLDTILPKFLAFVAGKRLGGHNVEFDMSFILKACDDLGYALPVPSDALDTLFLARTLYPTFGSFQLGELASRLDISAESAHRALSDARTTGHILTELRKRAAGLPFITLQQLAQLAGFMSPLTAEWLESVAEARFAEMGSALPPGREAIDQLVFAPEGTPEAREADTARTGAQRTPNPDTAFVDTAAAVLRADGPLMAALPDFEVRAGQAQMLEAVAKAFDGDEHLLVEAGTGTGKSLAYLIPAALYAAANDTRVVVATHTIALQDQIRDRDFPTLRRVLQHPLALAVFKGRTHYICMRKLAQETRAVGIGSQPHEIESYMGILTWLVDTQTGSREELPWTGKSDTWQSVQSETETCINKRCPFFRACFYFRARSKAYEADVVVTNHSLILSDLKAEHRVLPRYQKLVIDEAHHLEDAATKHLGEQVQWAQCSAHFARLTRESGKHGLLPELIQRTSELDTESSSNTLGTLESLLELTASLRVLLDSAFQTLSRLIPSGQGEFRITGEVEGTPQWSAYLGIADDLVMMSQEMNRRCKSLESRIEVERDEEYAGRLTDAVGWLHELLDDASVLVNVCDIRPEFVVWIEQFDNRRYLSVHRVPVEVATVLKQSLFDTKDSVVLTSATLSVGGSFDFIKSRLGLEESDRDGRLSKLSVESPFQFRDQVLLCVPQDSPDLYKLPTEEASEWLSAALLRLASATGGRTLVLFTSHALLRATADRLRDGLSGLGQRLYAQGIDGGRSRLLEWFKANPNSVLLGAQSFWEGIDLPGDELTTLVITRLPFAPPTHPITAARHERLEEQGMSSFWNSSLPDAIVRFRQGFGRLIRTSTDRGVVVVYDKRIVTARYGTHFVKSLYGVVPKVAPQREIEQAVQQFLHMPTRSSHSSP